MNPFKQIQKLERKVETLQADNANLRFHIDSSEKLKRECELKIKLAEEKELEYQKLIMELQSEHNKYVSLNHKLELVIKKVKSTYKKAFTDIRKDFTTR